MSDHAEDEKGPKSPKKLEDYELGYDAKDNVIPIKKKHGHAEEHHDSLWKKAAKWAGTTTGATIVANMAIAYFFFPDFFSEVLSEIGSSLANLVISLIMTLGLYVGLFLLFVFGLGKSWEAAKKPFAKAGGGHGHDAKPAGGHH